MIGVCFALGRPGSVLLSHALGRSTIDAVGFLGRVRDGIGSGTHAMTTGSSKRETWGEAVVGGARVCGLTAAGLPLRAVMQAYRAISTG